MVIQTEEQFLNNFTKTDNPEAIKIRKILYKYADKEHSENYMDMNWINYKTCLLTALELYYNVIDPVIITWQSDQDYQGDTITVIKDPTTSKFYYCSFGWGSCSGCDILEFFHNEEDKVVQELQNDIVPVPIDIRKYIENELVNGYNKDLVKKTLEQFDSGILANPEDCN